MLIIKTPSLLRKHIDLIQSKNKRIALVPTMGNLHEGHMNLVDQAKMHADIVIVSIFINPMQFSYTEDLSRYPRTPQEDYEKLNKRNIDFVFTPTLTDMYPRGIKDTTYVDIPYISKILEGANRPKHFRGVLTIICKLFNLIQPDVAFFGKKDYQQLMLIRRMVLDMNYHIDIYGVSTARTEDGLALSSRNNYLTDQQLKIAPELNKTITKIVEDISSYKNSIKKIISTAKINLKEKGFRVEELQIRDADTLLELTSNSRQAVILVTAWLGQARLIDNRIVKLKTGKDFENILKTK